MKGQLLICSQVMDSKDIVSIQQTQAPLVPQEA